MPAGRSLVAPTSNAMLERALLEKLQRRVDLSGGLGELEPLAVRIGLMQRTLKPRLQDPQLFVFVADHGLAVDGIAGRSHGATDALVKRLLSGQLPMAVFARQQQMQVNLLIAFTGEAIFEFVVLSLPECLGAIGLFNGLLQQIQLFGAAGFECILS